MIIDDLIKQDSNKKDPVEKSTLDSLIESDADLSIDILVICGIILDIMKTHTVTYTEEWDMMWNEDAK